VVHDVAGSGADVHQAHSEDGVLPQPPGGRAGHHLDRREEVVVLHGLSRPPEYQLLHLTSVALDHHPELNPCGRLLQNLYFALNHLDTKLHRNE